MLIYFFLILTIIFPVVSYAESNTNVGFQETVDCIKNEEETVENCLSKYDVSLKNRFNSNNQKPSSTLNLSDTTKAEIEKLILTEIKDLSNYRKSIYKYNNSVYTLQFIQTIFIFVASLCLLATSIYLTIIQVRKSQQNFNSELKIKIGSGELEISSAVTGIILFSLVLIFFYIYIDKVYKIDSDLNNNDKIPGISELLQESIKFNK